MITSTYISTYVYEADEFQSLTDEQKDSIIEFALNLALDLRECNSTQQIDSILELSSSVANDREWSAAMANI